MRREISQVSGKQRKDSVAKKRSKAGQHRPATALEALVDRFVGSLDPSELLRSVDAIGSEDAARLPALLLRSGLVQTMRDEDRAARRDDALQMLAARVHDIHGSEARAGIERAVHSSHWWNAATGRCRTSST